jgi:hypothetical protein
MLSLAACSSFRSPSSKFFPRSCESTNNAATVSQFGFVQNHSGDPIADQNRQNRARWTTPGQSLEQWKDAVEINLPNDPAIMLNVKQLGVKGDGITDDTAAIQQAIHQAGQTNRALYFPNGTYRVTQEIRFKNADGSPLRAGPHLYGQSRDGVVLKLDDNLPQFRDANRPTRAVIRAVDAEDGTTWRDISADFFNRFMINFTIDTGNNPGAVGIKFYSNNTGILQNVRIIGQGAIGLDLNAVDLNGPHLIQNIEIRGFDIGIRSAGSNSATVSNAIIQDAASYGLYHIQGVLQVEQIRVENAPVAVFTKPTQLFGRTTLTLVNGQLRGSDPTQPAIVNGDLLFARNITSQGFSTVLREEAGSNNSNNKINTLDIGEYSSHGVSKKFAGNTDRSLNLPIEYFPLTYDPKPEQWISVKDYGAVPGDNVDDTASIQAAIDAAAASGKTTIYFPGLAKKDPNWYTVNGTVQVRGSVKHILGFAPARLRGDGGFKVIDDTRGSKFVQFQGFNFSNISYENASSRTVRLTNLTGSIQATGSGKLFLNSVAGGLSIENPRAQVWARQLNTEQAGDSNIVNNGGTLWVLGQKTEKEGLKARIFNGAKTEILGAFIYSVGKRATETESVYEVVDANASFAGVRERTGNRKYPIFVRETQNGITALFTEAELPTGNEYNRGFSLYSASRVPQVASTCSMQ